MNRRTGLFFAGLAILLLVTSATAEPLAPRPFAPVQGGFVETAELTTPYRPGTLRIQLSQEAIATSDLADLPMRRGATMRAATGLPLLDAVMADLEGARIERQHDMPQDQTLARELGVDRWFVLRFDEGTDVGALARQLEADPAIEHALPDWRVYPMLVPNDPLYDENWGHNNTAQMLSYDWSTHSHENGDPVGTVGFDSNAEAAWTALGGYGRSSVIIAIIDSGVDTDHPDINCVQGYDYGDNDADPDDDSSGGGHGTCCAGVAAAIADNNSVATGVAGGCSIMPMKIATSSGSMYVSSMPPAIYYAVDNGAKIISMSLGAPLSSEPDTDAAIEYAWNHGVLVLAATGNENDSAISYPSNNAYVVGVGAASPCGDRKRSSSSVFEVNSGVSTDPNGYTCDGERWWGSNYGVTTPDAAGAVDVIAPTILPTTDILGSGGYTSGDYDMWFNGTSCATPYAAGVCALIASANPTWDAAQIREQLVTTAQDIINVESGSGWDRYSGYGMVDAEAAVGGGGAEYPPVAEFVGSPTSGEVSLTVSFTDQSTYSPTSWSWTFGDGGTSTAQNPSYTYASPGTYDVSLVATNAYGSDTETKVGYITVTAPTVTADFTADPLSGEPPLVVQFTDASTNATSWHWDFGDGATSTAQNPSHTYSEVGVYTVTLEATGPYGSDTEAKADLINVAVMAGSYAVSDIPVTGTVSGSYLNTHSSDNVRETITEELYTGHPRKRYSYLEHKWLFNVDGGTTVTFHLEAARPASSDGDDFVFSYSTDNATFIDLLTVASATEQVYSASLPSGTSGPVYIRVVDTARSWDGLDLDSIAIDEMFIESNATPQPPVADFVGDPTSGYVPLTVQFTDTSTGSPTSWSWTFGDGGTSTAQSPSHTYNAVGTYSVSMTATNAQGSDSVTKTGYITVTDEPQGDVMHVADITVTRMRRGNGYVPVADVTVVDGGGAPVSGATVTGFFNAPSTVSKSGVTGTNGVTTITGDKDRNPPADFCFTVTDVSLAGWTYDSGANVVTTGCESGYATAYELSGGVEHEIRTGLQFTRPNPFRGTAEIAFSLANESDVRLEIFNVAGRKVATLADRAYTAGTHSVYWDAGDAPSGVYFCRMTADGVAETRRMIVLK